MPQLDKFAFIGEVFWFLVFFFVVYVYVFNRILPHFFFIMRLRQQRLDVFLSSIRGFFYEEVLLLDSYYSAINKILIQFSTTFLQLNQSFNNWLILNKEIFN